MLYFQMRTNNIDGIIVEEMIPCEGWENETVFRLNERLNPTLAADILANPTKYWFDADGVLWQRAAVSNLFADANMEAADMAAWTVNAGGGTGTAAKSTNQHYDGVQSVLLTGGTAGVTISQALDEVGNNYTLCAHVYVDGLVPPEGNFKFIANGEEVAAEYQTSAKEGWFTAIARNIAWSASTWGFKVAAGAEVYVDAVSMNIADTEVDVTPPAAPTGLAVSSIIGGLRITHDPNTEDDLAGYEIYVAPAATGTAKGLTNPSVTPTLSQGTGGSVADGIYYVKYTWNNGIGETQASTSASIQVSGGGGTASIGVQVPAFPHGCSKMKVYVSTNNTTFYYDGESTINSYTITDIPNSGANPPASNTTVANSTKIADTLSNWPDDIWKDGTITITGGTGSGQTRTISGNTETEITIAQAWATTPNSTSTYKLSGPYTLAEFGMKTKWEILSLERKMSYNVKARAYDTSGNYSSFTNPVLGTVGYDSMRAFATVVIAAEDSRQRDYADLVVPIGVTNAEQVIHAAMALLPNGKGHIVLLDGTFTIDRGIVLWDGIRISGQGTASIIRRKNNACGMYIFTNHDHTNGTTNLLIENLTLDGNKAGSSLMCNGVNFYYISDTRIQGLTVRQCRNEGIFTSHANGLIIADCTINGNYNGINSVGSVSCLIASSRVYDNANCGIITNGVDTIDGNYVDNNICIGIYAIGGTIRGNYCRHNGDSGIYTGASIVTTNCCSENSTYGIYVGGYINTIVSANRVTLNSYDGIRISGAASSNIVGNVVRENGQAADNTYSEIIVISNASENLIQGNFCRKKSAVPRSKYGIRINDSTCIANIVTNNDCYQSGVVAGISNAGTGTCFGAGNRNNDGTWSTTPN